MLKDDKLVEAIEQLKNGNVEGFNYIYSETFNFVYSRAKYMLGDEELALDLTQEVYMILYNKIGDLNSSDSLYAWLKTVIFHKGLRFIEKRNKTVLLSEESEGIFDTLQDESVEFEEEIINQEDVQIIKNCINGLSDEQRLVILAYYYDNMKTHEIAETLNISEGTVKSRLSLARKHLKSMILEQEKKQGYKLHSFGAVTMAFTLGDMLNSNMGNAAECMQNLLPTLCSQLGLGISATSEAVEGATPVVNNGVKEGTKLAKKALQKTASKGTKKIVVGILGSVAVTVAVGTAILGSINKTEPKQETPVIEAEQIESDIKSEYKNVYKLTKKTWCGSDGSVTYYEYVYNEEENKATVIKYHGDGSKKESWEHTFDEKGNLISEIKYDEDEAVDYRIEYAYDEMENLISQTRFGSDDTMKKRMLYAYDEMGNLIRETYDYSDDVFFSYHWTEYTYDESGKRLSAIVHQSDGTISSKSEYLYEKNLLMKMEYVQLEKSIDLIMEYTYDEDGNMLSEIVYHYYYDSAGVKKESCSEDNIYTYDEDGNLLSGSYGIMGAVTHKYEYTYDDNGNPTSRINYDADGNISSETEYEYEEVQMTENEKTFYKTKILEVWKNCS